MPRIMALHPVADLKAAAIWRVFHKNCWYFEHLGLCLKYLVCCCGETTTVAADLDNEPEKRCGSVTSILSATS